MVLPCNSYYFSKANCDGPSIIIAFHNLSVLPHSLPLSKLKICSFQKLNLLVLILLFFLYFIYCYFPKGKELQDYQQILLESLMDHSKKCQTVYSLHFISEFLGT